MTALTAERLLPARSPGALPWLIAPVMALAVLAVAAALALAAAGRVTERSLAGRLTVQVVEPNPDRRAELAAETARRLAATAGVRNVRALPAAEVRDLLTPWLGADALDETVPLPALIDADLSLDASTPARVAALGRALGPQVRVERQADWMAPVARLLRVLQALGLAVGVLAAAALALTAALGVGAAIARHRTTIDVMHLMGASDGQIARLFAHATARDAAWGCVGGFAAGAVAALLVGRAFDAAGAGLAGGAGLGPLEWALLALLPVGGVLLVYAAARAATVRALVRTR